ncbi:MAG: ASKHA domain-containing protein [Treponema sp.]|jgi:uncharacterized 2Fe-2S/4Fe-4S cluster protein (DUF4445 family)|nr:ASKHA domain-containing protein [Treponema sp.]
MKIFLHNSSLVCNAAAGETVLLACARNGLMLSAPCGGRQRCGKCRVQLLEGKVAGETPDAEGFVRACAAVPLSDITIACPTNVELSGNEVTALPVKNASTPVRAGVALDIGTTTVSARLVNLDTQAAVDTISELNDQRAFGADVMSRIGAAQKGKTEELFTAINRQTEQIITQFKDRWNIQHIEQLAVSGNTVMMHLFLNVDPSGMGSLPFTPAFLEGKALPGAALSLSTAHVSVLPSIAAFIGSDICAGLATLDMGNTPGPSLLVDIGTNGEMALCNKGTILCCSTAAGPAFEGAEISCGMGGVKGAVSGVEITVPAMGNTLSVTTIGNVPPEGICGSGLIDAVAVMLKQGIIDETGSMTGALQYFEIAPNVSVTARDIRQFQLAKSAILSGIKILCKQAGLQTADIRNVYIAGGFGFFINKYNAQATGIFPGDFTDSLSVCGNLSLRGAEESLAGGQFAKKCRQIISRCSVIDLAADPSFMDEFAENMLFAEKYER